MTDKKNQRFTFDAESEGAEVPTLTSLLYKKNVVKSTGSPRQNAPGVNAQIDYSKIMTLDPTVTQDTTHASITTPTTPTEKDTPTPELVIPQVANMVKETPSTVAQAAATAAKRVTPSQSPLRDVSPMPVTAPNTYTDTQPVGSGIQYLFNEAKVSQVLLFQSRDPNLLAATTIVGDAANRAHVWTGMEFSKQDFNDLWGRLEKYSFAEFSTLGIAGQGNVDRIAFRNAFQVQGTEWLTLVRVRQSTGGEALLAIFSEGSIQAHIPNFHTACLAPTAAKAA